MTSDESSSSTARLAASVAPIAQALIDAIEIQTLKDVELFFAFVGPMGTNTDAAKAALEEALDHWNYRLNEIKLSELVKNKPVFGDYIDDMTVDDHYKAAIAAGNKARKLLRSNDALAQMAIAELVTLRARILEERKSAGLEQEGAKLPRRQAYIFRSLKRPEEIQTLRRIYGPAFFVISIHGYREARRDRLAKRIKTSHKEPDFGDKEYELAEALLTMDEYETEVHGQRVRDAFPEADFFTSSDEAEELKTSIGRFISAVFRKPFVTPSRGELAMSQARAAAVRSADLSRQIGSVIATPDGEVVAVGCNDVPRFGGGQYFEGDEDDARDFHLTYDPNDAFKDEVIGDFLGRMASRGWLTEVLRKLTPQKLTEAATKGDISFIDGSRVDRLIEFGRIMHAEMAAIADAARRGLPIEGLDLYCTTFPCHMCARLIIGSGIKRVFYIEPYPKSITHELFAQQIVVDPSSTVCGKVTFQPFSGIAPRRFFDLFSFPKGSRKKNGRVIRPDKNTAQPRVELISTAYLETEVLISEKLGIALDKLGTPGGEHGT